MEKKEKKENRKLDEMFVADFRKATLHQLQTILRHDKDCDLIYRCVAQAELERRAWEHGLPINVDMWSARAAG